MSRLFGPTLQIIFFFLNPQCFLARNTPKCIPKHATITHSRNHNYTWQNFEGLLDTRRGSEVSSMSELKKYFLRFGYLPVHKHQNLTDKFDDRLEQSVARYQAKFGIPVTGKLDSRTLSQIMSPRCGLPDMSPEFHGIEHYTYFTGQPRWTQGVPITLTYAFSPENLIESLSLLELRDTFKRAFARWASVIPVTFIETGDYGFANIKIGFYAGDHGDGEPFDGVLGVLAHSFSPESGRLHLDAAETWAVDDFRSQKSEVAVDLESVATHEIGHLLGLGHSWVKEAVMYPSLKPRDKKVDLNIDDIKGVQALYGSNPDFKVGALSESDISSNCGVGERLLFSNLKPVSVSVLVFVFLLCK